MERYRQQLNWCTYWVNSRTLEVHSCDCPYLPRVNEVYLGSFSSLRMATLWAKLHYGIGADPCSFCDRRWPRHRFNPYVAQDVCEDYIRQHVRQLVHLRSLGLSIGPKYLGSRASLPSLMKNAGLS